MSIKHLYLKTLKVTQEDLEKIQGEELKYFDGTPIKLGDEAYPTALVMEELTEDAIPRTTLRIVYLHEGLLDDYEPQYPYQQPTTSPPMVKVKTS